MQVDDQILNCTAFIGTPLERGGFYAEGTGFFVEVSQDGLSLIYLVTCRHVISRLSAPAIRISGKGKPPSIIPTGREDWIGHPRSGIDICMFPFDLAKWDSGDDLDIGTISSQTGFLTPKSAEHFGFSLGIEVFIVGVFVGRIGEAKNIPVVRFGNVAAMPIEPAFGSPQPAYLIETHSLGGVSGSPVFLHTSPKRLGYNAHRAYPNPQTGRTILPYLLVGMIVSSHSGQYSSDFVADDPDRIQPPKDVDFNAGISVALPVEQILEALHQTASPSTSSREA